jgi:hypothetical protein
MMERFPMSSKRNNHPPLLEYLFDLGRQVGGTWIAEHGDALGQRSTIDLERLLPAFQENLLEMGKIAMAD